MLFFSGGSAFRETAGELARRGEPMVHLVTPFDSGGSTAELRRVFAMPAVGDIRARILAIAPASAGVSVLNLRLPTGSAGEAFAALDALVARTHPLLRAVPSRWRRRVSGLLGEVREVLPPDFDPRWASVGNLVLTALYLEHGRSISRAAALFGRLVGARGMVRLVADANAHLCVRLKNGQTITGQHLFTGKTTPPIASPVKDLWITPSLYGETPLRVPLAPETGRLIRRAGLIVYPVGSFYSSVLANLLPEGTGGAIRRARCRKVFIPNAIADPESLGLSLKGQVEHILKYAPVTHVLVDDTWRGYPGGIPARWLRDMGIRLVRRGIMDAGGRLEGEAAADILIGLKQAEPEA